jgi:branched-chain amino acid transport system permease protein
MKITLWLRFLIIICILIAIPFVFRGEYWMNIVILSGVYVILAEGLNLMVGVSGQFIVCFAAFYGIGAYSSALLVIRLGLPFWVSMPISGLLAAIVGAGVGFICNRFRGHYVALVTLSFGVIFYEIVLQWLSLTKGPMGLINIPSPEALPLGILTLDFKSKIDFYVVVVLLVILCIASMKRLVDSRIGRALLAIREDDLAAEVLGININKYKIKVFWVGAWWAGLAGAFYAHYAGIIVPGTFNFFVSVEVLVMVIVGGMGSLYGVLISAFILTILPEFLRSIQFLRWIIYGIILMVMIIFMPSGIAGAASVIRDRIFRKLSVNESNK